MILEAMRPFVHTLPFDEALRHVLAAPRPIGRSERVSLAEADGRALVCGVLATFDVPPFDRAAMDGYAVIAADTAGTTPDTPATLRLVGRVFTGDRSGERVTAGTCVEIATGAPLPDGADAVVMVEQTTPGDGAVQIHRAATPRQHVGPRGGDITSGHVVLDAGVVLTPARIGVLAALGRTDVEVYARPRVAILCTGDEVVDPGQPLGPGQLYNVNRFTLEALVRRHGGEPVVLPTSRDSIEALTQTLGEAGGCDILVFSGGSSVGERDLVIDALRQHGEVIFHGVAIKPGKPTVFGRIGNAPVLGLSGYPTSCLSNAHVFLIPLLRATARLPPWQPRQVTLPLARRITSTPGRLQFYMVRIINGQAEPAFKASGDITSMAHADGYVTIAADTAAVEADADVVVTLYGDSHENPSCLHAFR
ncbi:MAG: molybdopterin molybdenumtransferase MoeA [Acidobacteria bacterium]|nr:molybdopterin molybdenumtransferase MoeA [Acidobacteriota bacterium]